MISDTTFLDQLSAQAKANLRLRQAYDLRTSSGDQSQRIFNVLERETILHTDGRHPLTKSITLNPGKVISFQIHHPRSETWTFVQGEDIFVLDGQEQEVKAGDIVVIPVEHWYAIKALTKLTFIEVKSGNPLFEENIERSEWSWRE